MKYSKGLKVEIKLDNNPYANYREVYYRIAPSDIPPIRRWFCNPWKKFYHGLTLFSGAFYLYDIDRYYTEIANRIKTWGDVCDYLKNQDEIIEKSKREWREIHDEKLKNHEIWPDEPAI